MSAQQVKAPLLLLSRHNLCGLHSAIFPLRDNKTDSILNKFYSRAKIIFGLMKSFASSISESRQGFFHDGVAEISINDPIRLANALGVQSECTMK